MWLFYILSFAIIIMGIISKTNKASKRYIFVIFGFLGILMMFRSINVGNDTDQYTKIFNAIAQVDDTKVFVENSRYEVGYIYLNRLLSFISNDAQILFIFTGFITAFSFGRFIYKYSMLPWMSAFMFLTLQFFDLSMSGVRQILSIAILLFSYDFIIKRKPIKFLLVVLLATTIHTSAIMFLILYPLATIKITKKFYWISGTVTIAVFIGFRYLIPLIGRVFPQYINYLTREGNSYTNNATLAVFLMLGLWLILFFIAEAADRKKKQINDEDLISAKKTGGQIVCSEVTALNVHKIAVWLSILMLFLALQASILNRFKYIYSVSMLILYPNALSHIKDGKSRNILITGSCLVFFVYIMVIYIFRPEWQSTYPYTFFWQ